MQLPDMPTFQAGLFVPSYKAMRQGAGELRVSGMSMAPGYWCGTVLVQDMAALLRGALPFWRRSSRNTAALPMKSP